MLMPAQPMPRPPCGEGGGEGGEGAEGGVGVEGGVGGEGGGACRYLASLGPAVPPYA